MATHELKTIPEYYIPAMMGVKPFEVRKNDRGFYVNDVLRLKEWEPETEKFTGREFDVLVVHIFRNMPWLKDGYVAMTVKPVADGLPVVGADSMDLSAPQRLIKAESYTPGGAEVHVGHFVEFSTTQNPGGRLKATAIIELKDGRLVESPVTQCQFMDRGGA